MNSIIINITIESLIGIVIISLIIQVYKNIKYFSSGSTKKSIYYLIIFTSLFVISLILEEIANIFPKIELISLIIKIFALSFLFISIKWTYEFNKRFKKLF